MSALYGSLSIRFRRSAARLWHVAALLFFELWEISDVMDQMLFIERNDWLSSHLLAARSCHVLIRDILIDCLDYFLHHVAAEVALPDDSICFLLPIKATTAALRKLAASAPAAIHKRSSSRVHRALKQHR